MTVGEEWNRAKDPQAMFDDATADIANARTIAAVRREAFNYLVDIDSPIGPNARGAMVRVRWAIRRTVNDRLAELKPVVTQDAAGRVGFDDDEEDDSALITA